MSPNRAGLRNPTFSAGASTRDRAVPYRTVGCPDCGVAAGEACLTAQGNLRSSGHRARRRMALRALDETYSAADIDYARSLLPATRQRIRTQRGRTRESLAQELGVSYSRVIRWESGGTNPSGPDGAAYGAWLRGHAS